MHFESTEQSQLLTGNFGDISKIKRIRIGNWPYFSTGLGESFLVSSGRRFVAAIDVDDWLISICNGASLSIREALRRLHKAEGHSDS